MVRISAFSSILCRRAFSTLRILPLSGRMAWKRRLRACLALPPALSPSTRNSSLAAGSRSEQSASLPGREFSLRIPLRRTSSRALRAASRARAASVILPTIFLAVVGSSSRAMANCSLTICSTRPLTSELPSFILVWPSNWGWGIFTLITANRPSRTSSPLGRLFILGMLALM